MINKTTQYSLYPNTIPITAEGTTTERSISDHLSDSLTFKDFGAVGDGITNDTNAVLQALETGKDVDGAGLVYLVSQLPESFSNVKNTGFLFNGIIYPTKDFMDCSLSKITSTLRYTGWTQDKVFSHKGIIYVPIQLAHGHTFDTTRIAWVKSYDDGNTFTAPEILVEQSDDPNIGLNSFSAGVASNRVVMVVEERRNSDKVLLDAVIYDRAMGFTSYKTNGIALTSGSSIAQINIENHGLLPGDGVWFSGVSGEGLGGLSGRLTVVERISADVFSVDKGVNSSVTAASTGGDWICGASYYDNNWRKSSLGDLTGAGGLPATHVHSFAVKNGALGQVFFGFHNGSSSPREVGAIYINDLWGNPTSYSFRRLPSDAEASQAEPVVRYDTSINRLYMTTRSQESSVSGSVFAYSDDDGLSYSWSRFPGNIHYSPLPFQIVDDQIYIFGTERGENEWEEGSPDNRLNQNQPRTFLIKVPLQEIVDFDFSNMTTTLLGYTRYEGEQVSSAAGVGSCLFHNGSLMYFFGGEDWRTIGRYSINGPDVDNEFLTEGYQPDIYMYRVSVNQPQSGVNQFNLIGADSQSLATYKTDSGYEVQHPVYFRNANGSNYLYSGKSSPTVGDIKNWLSARSSGSAFFPNPYSELFYSTVGAYAALAPATSPGNDSKRSYLCGGGAASAGRGGLVTAWGINSSRGASVYIGGTTLAPDNDNTTTLGLAGNRYSTVFSTNGTINTSDQRLKDDLGNVSHVEKQIASEIKIRKYKWSGENKIKFGVYAQEVESIFNKYGLNANDYDLFMYDENTDTYGINYNELIMFLLASS